jgi:putative two-component system response regulator
MIMTGLKRFSRRCCRHGYEQAITNTRKGEIVTMETYFEDLEGRAPTVMVVDDTPANLKLLGSMLGKRGYRVQAFPNGRLALRSARATTPDLILLDISMPEMDGYEVCRLLKEDPETRDVPVLFISARTETDDKLRAFSVGGLDYVTKPFQFDEVHARVSTHIRLRSLQLKTSKYANHLEEMVQAKVAEISAAQAATIHALAGLAESRDDDTGEHILRTRTYCRMLALELLAENAFADELCPAYVSTVFEAAALHDIGKVGIPDAILLKPGRLTQEEFTVMKRHVSVGGATLAKVSAMYPDNQFVRMGLDIARYHHERWDGNGYMAGLSGSEIPLSARIMAVADVYDALRSERPYKPAFSHAKAAGIIVEGGGSQFDPTVVAAFKRIADQFEVAARGDASRERGISSGVDSG